MRSFSYLCVFHALKQNTIKFMLYLMYMSNFTLLKHFSNALPAVKFSGPLAPARYPIIQINSDTIYLESESSAKN